MILRLGLILVVLLSVTAAAETDSRSGADPMYKLTLENHSPSPAELYCFHPPTLAPVDQQLHSRIIADLIDASHANLVFAPIVVNESFNAQQLPPAVAACWSTTANSTSEHGWYCLFSPAGRRLYEGQLDETLLSTLTDSPASRQVASALGERGQVVVLWLRGRADVGADPESVFEQVNEQFAASLTVRPGVHLTVVSPIEPAEEWLRRQLRSEAGPSSEEEPLAAVLFGRGRALRIRSGNELSVENLVADLITVSTPHVGPMHELPGFDLLLNYDWIAPLAAEPALAVTTPIIASKPALPEPISAASSASSLPTVAEERQVVPGLATLVAASLAFLFWLMFFIICSH